MRFIVTKSNVFSVAYRHTMTKHQYYLQLRKDILEERVRCGIEDAMLLASLALQAEFGDYQPEVPNLVLYIFFFHSIFPFLKQLKDLKTNLINLGAAAPWEDLFQNGALPPSVCA